MKFYEKSLSFECAAVLLQKLLAKTSTQVNYCRGKILHAYGDIAGHCGRFGAESDWLNLGAPMCRCHA